jgi:hypothetical protein
MSAARLVQIHQGLLQTMSGCLGQPWMLSLGVGQLVRSIGICNPCPAAAVLTALFQPDIPHRTARAGDAIRVILLLASELEPKTPTGQHDSTHFRRGDEAFDCYVHQNTVCAFQKVAPTTDKSADAPPVVSGDKTTFRRYKDSLDPYPERRGSAVRPTSRSRP